MSAGRKSLAFDPSLNISYIASGRSIKRVSDQERTEEFLYENEISCISFSQQGLLIGDTSGTTYLLQSVTSTEKNFITRVHGCVNSIASSNSISAICGNQEDIVILQDQKETHISLTQPASILTLCISPDAQYIAAVAKDGYVSVFQGGTLKKRTQLTPTKITESSAEMFYCEFSPDSQKLGLPGDMMFRYLSAPDFKYFPTAIACNSSISIVRWPVADFIITASLDHCVRVFDFQGEKKLYEFKLSGSIWDFVYSKNSILVVLAGKEEFLKEIEIEKKHTEANDDDKNENEEKEENNVDKELFDRIIGVYPQEALVPQINDKALSVLFRCVLGTVITREYYTASKAVSRIEVEFDDVRFHMNISIPNTHNFTLAYLGEKGVLLGSQASEAGLEGFVSDVKSSCILFKGLFIDCTWKLYLPNMEIPEYLCVSCCCLVYTSANYLRIFNAGGIQLYILSMSAPVISMASYNDQVAIIYHSAAPVLGCQSITGEIWHLNELGIQSEAEYFKEEFRVAISPEQSLTWVGFSDTGILFTVDSADIVRTWWKRANTWLPVCTLEDYSRVVGVTNEGLLVNAKEDYAIIESVPFKLPFCKSKFNDYEEKVGAGQVFFEADGESDKRKKILELDRTTIDYFIKATDEGDVEKAFAYGIQAKLEKSRLLCIRYAQDLKVMAIAERLAKHFEIALPSRFVRPEKPQAEAPAQRPEPRPAEVKPREVPKENQEERPEAIKNPFGKTTNGSKDLFDALTSGVKRKIEPSQVSLKKIKK